MIDKTENQIIQHWKSDNSQPIVSICCITYNHENYLSEALDSFLMQETDFPFEIIIRDDASTDKTAILIKEYENKYPNIIKPIYEKENGLQQGIKPLPVAIKRARGEYIAICEGDDYWTDSKKLQIQLTEMKKYPDYKMSFHPSSELRAGVNVLPKLHNTKKFYSVEEIITCDFHLIQTNTVMIKKESLDSLNIELHSNSPVGDVWIRLTASIPNGIMFIDKMMSTYRVASSGSWSESIQRDNKFIDYVTKMFTSIDDFDKYWEYKYTKAFKEYKNKYIETMMKKNDIPKERKKTFLSSNISSISLKNFLYWHIIYRHNKIVNTLKYIKKVIQK